MSRDMKYNSPFVVLCTVVLLTLGGFCPELLRADTVADSVDDWSGTGEQGANGWSYGYYLSLIHI